jgi:hypothetical protein
VLCLVRVREYCPGFGFVLESFRVIGVILSCVDEILNYLINLILSLALILCLLGVFLSLSACLGASLPEVEGSIPSEVSIYKNEMALKAVIVHGSSK